VLHRRDPRSKTLALLVFLVLVATTTRSLPVLGAVYFMLLCASLVLARLPFFPALARAAVVVPFTIAFALVTWLAGDPARGLALIAKSYLSALGVLILVSTTALPELLRGFEMLGVPRFILMIGQFLYRYLFVISHEAQHMRAAAASRGGGARSLSKRDRFRAAAGALAVLFARSYARAENIHQAMLARGFQGHFHLLAMRQFGWADAAFLAIATALPVAARVMLGVRG
jgi:cobalt/nickel transport system permease protein